MKRSEALDHVKKLTTDDRNKTHGDPGTQFEKAQRIKDAVGHHQCLHLTPVEVEAIEHICTKLSRWTSGTTRTSEHALDIIGYAAIAVEAFPETPPAPAPVAKAEHPIAELQRRAAPPAEDASPPPPPRSEFAGIDQVARRFAPNPRKVEPPPEGSAA